MSKLRIGILRGGPSSEYDVSLQTGATLLRHMPDKYQVHDIFISRDGVWHRDGVEREPHRALRGIDLVFNGLHGHYGEDGKVQRLLDHMGIPYTGSGPFASAIGMNKVLSKKAFEHHGIKSPYWTSISKHDNIAEKADYVFHHFYLPFIVKPATGGSSVGVTVVKNFRDLGDALEKAFEYSGTALIEEFIRGREATCGVVEGFRGHQAYTLLPVEIVHPEGHEFFSKEAKYGGHAREMIPGNFSDYEKQEIQRLAKLAHESLGLRHYSRSDFIVTPRRGVYLLEVNTLPGLTPESLMPKSLEAIGCSIADFIEHIIRIAARL